MRYGGSYGGKWAGGCVWVWGGCAGVRLPLSARVPMRREHAPTPLLVESAAPHVTTRQEPNLVLDGRSLASYIALPLDEVSVARIALLLA